MTQSLLDTEFTVADQIKVNHEWTEKYPEWKGLGDGILMILDPPCPAAEDFTGLSAAATTSSRSGFVLAFDKAVVNNGGYIGLFFEDVSSDIVPTGSKVRFVASSDEPMDGEDQFVAQGSLEVPEANKILPRLAKEGIRFRIDTDVSAHARSYNEARIGLFVHVNDLPAWERIRPDYLPE